jgi:two-component system, response regulator PdtaR
LGNDVLPGPTREPITGSFLVLVVEDEALLALDLELTILRHGWRVLGPAGTVEEALELLKVETPDVALLDVNLRGTMVTPVAEELRALGVPFVLASAYERPEAAAPALAGVPNLGKPTNERRLLVTLRNALRA